jgi:alpha-galactosidase
MLSSSDSMGFLNTISMIFCKKYCLILFVFSLKILCIQAQNTVKVAQKPPLGWNSFDSYGVYLYEKAAFDNLRALAKKYKQYGYEYFVVDNGWFGEYKLKEGTMFAAEKHASDVHINEYGLVQPSKTYFPNGFKALIDECHALGLKFGFHLMRGIPRKAVWLNTPIKGTSYRAQDIADTTSICNWCAYNCGVDMSKAGAQEFYNSLINQMAEWGVDMIKADDIVPFPKEVEGLAKAVAQCGRPMILSLSPGGKLDENAIGSFKTANMLRVTPDIWDEQEDIDKCFAAWRKWQGQSQAGFWIDMDMIPFGELQLMSPPKSDENKEVKLSGKGTTRHSHLSKAQMRTFITLRALSASPLMIGGDLPTMDDYSYQLLTNPDMVAANQNGIMGSLVYEKEGIEIWKTPRADGKGGWIGIFNRLKNKQTYRVQLQDLGLIKKPKTFNVWVKSKKKIIGKTVEIEGNDVVFLRYE